MAMKPPELVGKPSVLQPGMLKCGHAEAEEESLPFIVSMIWIWMPRFVPLTHRGCEWCVGRERRCVTNGPDKPWCGVGFPVSSTKVYRRRRRLMVSCGQMCASICVCVECVLNGVNACGGHHALRAAEVALLRLPVLPAPFTTAPLPDVRADCLPLF